jgi:hypothetical protein
MNTTNILRSCFAILLAAISLAPPVSALDYPMSSTAIRDAYFLGSGDPEKLLLYLDKYAKHYPIAKTAQYIGSVRFETPYYIIAEYVSRASANGSYHAPDAEQQFLGKSGLCRVRIEIYYGNATLPGARIQTNYAIQLTQHDKKIAYTKTWTEGMVSSDDGSVPVGMYVTTEYNADDIDSSAPATVEITQPDGGILTETFDLDSLR